MGDVYKAEDTTLGRPVALKFILADIIDGHGALERFHREARAASSLNHPNICTIYDFGECDTRTFIAMEFLEGESLRERRRRGALAPELLLTFAIQAAEGLSAAHAKGIVHRDIKPENLFIVGDKQLKILDFGLAKHERVRPLSEVSTNTPETPLTGPGVAAGTLPYMSPEQARAEDVDARSDIFSLAAVLFELAAGRRAFEGTTAADIHAAVLKDEPILPSSVEPRLCGGLQPILDRALEKDREFRYQHVSDLAADLKRLLRDFRAGRLLAVVAATRTPATPPSTLRLLGGDLTRAALVAALTITAHATIDTSPSGRYLDQFLLSLVQENLARGRVDQADFEAGGRHLPLVIDISLLHPDKRQPTDRSMLDTLINELQQGGARAIGVDLSFDDLRVTDFRYFEKWRRLKNVRVGIYRRAAEPRDAWLGRPEFADLAAGLAMPGDNPQHAFAYLRRWSLTGPLSERERSAPVDCRESGNQHNCKDDLYQLPVALWLVADQDAAGGDGVRSPRTTLARVARMVERRDIEDEESGPDPTLEFGTYAIDYSFLKELKRDVITLPSAPTQGAVALIAELREQRARVADRVVLIGDLEDTSDQFCPTARMSPLPGVLVHGCALASWNRGMLLQARSSIGRHTAWALIAVLLTVIITLRLVHGASRLLRQIPHAYLEIVVFGFLSVVAVIAARWLASAHGMVWPSVFWVAAALAFYAVSEPLWRALVSLAGIARLVAVGAGRPAQGG